jgi:hypothetical protein
MLETSLRYLRVIAENATLNIPVTIGYPRHMLYLWNGLNDNVLNQHISTNHYKKHVYACIRYTWGAV